MKAGSLQVRSKIKPAIIAKKLATCSAWHMNRDAWKEATPIKAVDHPLLVCVRVERFKAANLPIGK